MSEKEREWTLTASEVLDRDVEAGTVPVPDPEQYRPKSEPETWHLEGTATVRVKGEFRRGWSWWRPRKASDL